MNRPYINDVRDLLLETSQDEQIKKDLEESEAKVKDDFIAKIAFLTRQ